MAISDKELADRLARAALEVCPACARGDRRADIHNGAPADYHGYEYNPCGLPAALREALDLWRKARAPAGPELVGTWQGVPVQVLRPPGLSDHDWQQWKTDFTGNLG